MAIPKCFVDSAFVRLGGPDTACFSHLKVIFVNEVIFNTISLSITDMKAAIFRLLGVLLVESSAISPADMTCQQ